MLDYSKRKCYGFVKSNSDEFIINEIEATNVKLIFECFLNGMSLSEISKELYSQGINSPSGKDTWSRKVISCTLSNEKYSIYGIVEVSVFESAQTDKDKRTSKSTDKAEITNETVKADETVALVEDTNVCEVSKTMTFSICISKAERLYCQIGKWLIKQLKLLRLHRTAIKFYYNKTQQLYHEKHWNTPTQISNLGQGFRLGCIFFKIQINKPVTLHFSELLKATNPVLMRVCDFRNFSG